MIKLDTFMITFGETLYYDEIKFNVTYLMQWRS